MSTSQGKAQRRFHQIPQEEYERAPVPSPVAGKPSGDDPAGRTRDVSRWTSRLLWAGAAAGATTVVYEWVRRRR